MPTEDHVSSEEIARLAEGGLPPEGAESLLPHLARCRSCMAAYVEAVRYRAAWLADRHAFDPRDELREIGRQVAGSTVSSRPRTPRRLLMATAPVAAGVLVVLLLWQGPWRRSLGTVELPRSIATALARQTHLADGLFLPGAESVRAHPAEILRGGEPNTNGFERLADSLGAEFRRATPRASRARAGYRYAAVLFITGRPQSANEVLDEVLAQEPGDCACQSLAAELDLATSPERAERHLREAVAHGCRDPLTRMNLAIVQRSLGDASSAARTFQRLAGRKDAIGERARAELSRRD